MGLTIEILNIADIHLDSGFLVQYCDVGVPFTVRTVSYLIKGHAEGPILIDTGFRCPEIMETIGFKGVIPEDGGLEWELEKRGLRRSDIRYILHTHLHIDHAGKDDLFPPSTTVVVNRKELELGCSGLGGAGYPCEDVKHLVDRVYTKDAAWILDIDPQGKAMEILPGVAVQQAGGHTAGSINILVELDDGEIGCVCGDVIYHVKRQLVDRVGEINHRAPRISANTTEAAVAEKAAMSRAAAAGKWLLPIHDAPAALGPGMDVLGRVEGTIVPGPLTSLADYRDIPISKDDGAVASGNRLARHTPRW